MTIFQALILGIVQGATEFLPVSSSGHLVLVPWLFGWEFSDAYGLAFNVMLHWGTLTAVIVYFWRDLLAIAQGMLRGVVARQPWGTAQARLGWLLIAASLPAALLGLLLEDLIAGAFERPSTVSIFLLITAALLAISERLGKRERRVEQIGLLDALLIGSAQALALFPGLSRSGSTIAAGLLRGMERHAAARFSFLMAVPVMIGAGLLSFADFFQAGAGPRPDLLVMLSGFLSAAVIGFLAIRWLLRFLAERPVWVFAVYCAAAGSAGLMLSVLRG